MATKVVLVDDHGIMRSGLRALFEKDSGVEVVGEADQGRSAVSMVNELLPEVIIMDLRMPEMNGIEATRQIVSAHPQTKVIGLSTNTDRQSVIEMLRAGARGYVLKESAFEELSAAVRAVVKDKIYLSPTVTNFVVENWVDGDSNGLGPSVFGVLSPREREVLQLMAEGKATKEVAAALKVSVKTVETHRRNLMEKLHVDNVAELTKYAIREGLTSL